MKGQNDYRVSQDVINDIQNRMNAHIEKKNSSWRGMSSPDSMKSYTVDGEFNFRNFIRNRSVIRGFILVVLGIVTAIVSIYIPEGNVHMMVCIAAACLSFTGVGQITGHINKQTAKTIHQNKK